MCYCFKFVTSCLPDSHNIPLCTSITVCCSCHSGSVCLIIPKQPTSKKCIPSNSFTNKKCIPSNSFTNKKCIPSNSSQTRCAFHALSHLQTQHMKLQSLPMGIYITHCHCTTHTIVETHTYAAGFNFFCQPNSGNLRYSKVGSV